MCSMTCDNMFIEHSYKFQCRKYDTPMENEEMDAILLGNCVIDGCILDLHPPIGRVT